MNINLISIFWLVAICSCRRTDSGGRITGIDLSFFRTLHETRIEGINYRISIPEDYILTRREGPDFMTYYISSKDTTHAGFSAGFYIGNFPHQFEKENDSCSVQKIGALILDKAETWVVYNCQKNYSIQTVVESGSDEAWDRYFHLFGTGYSRDDVQKIIEIYTTLRKE